MDDDPAWQTADDDDTPGKPSALRIRRGTAAFDSESDAASGVTPEARAVPQWRLALKQEVFALLF